MAVDGEGWVRVATLDELREAKPARVSLGEEELVLVRAGDRVWAASDRCTHQGASLARGRVHTMGGTPTITCPAHGSRFQLSDGRVLRVPATSRLPGYEARVVEGAIEVRPGS